MACVHGDEGEVGTEFVVSYGVISCVINGGSRVNFCPSSPEGFVRHICAVLVISAGLVCKGSVSFTLFQLYGFGMGGLEQKDCQPQYYMVVVGWINYISPGCYSCGN